MFGKSQVDYSPLVCGHRFERKRHFLDIYLLCHLTGEYLERLVPALLVAPFFLFDAMGYAIGVMFAGAFLAILGYTFYISVAKELSFTKRVVQMSSITFGVAIISFLIGYGVKYFFGIEI